MWEDVSNTHIYGRTPASVLYFQRNRERGEEGRENESERAYKWDGGALQILSSVNSDDPHSFRSLILSHVAR